jgi:hypothetical protein
MGVERQTSTFAAALENRGARAEGLRAASQRHVVSSSRLRS